MHRVFPTIALFWYNNNNNNIVLKAPPLVWGSSTGRNGDIARYFPIKNNRCFPICCATKWWERQKRNIGMYTCFPNSEVQVHVRKTLLKTRDNEMYGCEISWIISMSEEKKRKQFFQILQVARFPWWTGYRLSAWIGKKIQKRTKMCKI